MNENRKCESNVNHSINIRAAVRRTGYSGGLFEYNRFRLYSILDMESFKAMDFDRLEYGGNHTWLLYRDGFVAPHRAYVLSKKDVYVYGK